MYICILLAGDYGITYSCTSWRVLGSALPNVCNKLMRVVYACYEGNLLGGACMAA